MTLYLRFVFSLFLLFSPSLWAAKTYVVLEPVKVYSQPDGEVIETWPANTIFTSASEDLVWIKVTGYVPETGWQPLRPVRYIRQSDTVKQKPTRYENAPNAVIYQTLKSRPSHAKAYRLLEPVTGYQHQPSKWEIEAKAELQSAPAKSTSNLGSEDTSLSMNKDKALQPVELENGYTFTSSYQNGHEIKVSGYFPDGKWQALNPAIWLKKPVRLQDRTKPTQYFRAHNSKRFAVIDKTKFELVVYEVNGGKQTKILKAPVALGYDRCLSKEKGGKCYYTPEGKYEIEFKLFDADGINWCIPKKMEVEFKDKIAKGERCWRGIMGNHALHFGNSLFLHGTSSPKSIGSRSTHGCVRLRNEDISMVYRLLDKGDQVLISETPEKFDLIALATQQNNLKHIKHHVSGKQPKITLIEINSPN